MKTIFKKFTKPYFVLVLSIAALPGLVNGEPQSLSSVNTDKNSTKPALKDSVRDKKTDFATLIALTLENGKESKIGSNLAPIIGLSKSMPMKKQEVNLSSNPHLREERAYYLIYENIDGTASKTAPKRTECAYLVRIRISGLDKTTRYFKTDLKGKLVKAVLSQAKLEGNGKGVKGSGVKTELDIDSPEVKETFEAEMKFWLKDWLTKQNQTAKPA